MCRANVIENKKDRKIGIFEKKSGGNWSSVIENLDGGLNSFPEGGSNTHLRSFN